MKNVDGNNEFWRGVMIPNDAGDVNPKSLKRKNCAGPGVTGPALRRGVEALEASAPAGLELPYVVG